MASDPIQRNDSAKGLGRFECLFPASSTNLTTAERGTIEVFLERRHENLATTTPDFALATVLKASWVLTLQCFIVAGIICFKYNGPTENELKGEKASQVHDEGTKDLSFLYITRVDPNELVSSFLRRFGQS